MCEPSSIMAASLAISVVSGVAGHMAQQAQADAQMQYQSNLQDAHNAAALNNANSAIREQVETSAAERTAEMQEKQSTAQELFNLQTERLRAQGEAAASSEAAGTAYDMLMGDYMRQEAQKKDVLQQQLKMQGVQHDFTVSGARDRADSRIKAQSGFVASPVSQPSWGLTALGIGADVGGKLGSFFPSSGSGGGSSGAAGGKKTYYDPALQQRVSSPVRH